MSSRPPASLPILISADFKTAFDELPKVKQRQAHDKIQRLATNPYHNSLNAHKLNNAKGMWECYINEGDRLIYEIEDSTLKLWKIGDHSLIDRVQALSFAENTAFQPFEQGATDAPSLFTAPPEWSMVAAPEQSQNPFADVSTSHLRILGVPTELIKTVREATSLEALEAIPGLPEHVLIWLTELATNPRIVFDPSRLIFRTTLDQLNGYTEGNIKRLMLNLTPDQQRFVDRDSSGAVLLRGCAGAGKTSVLIHRAIRYAMNGEKVLLLTYSRSLAHALADLIGELGGGDDENLHVTNLDAWIVKLLSQRGLTFDIASEPESKQALQTAIAAVRPQMNEPLSGYPFSFFRDEIRNTIKSNALLTLDQYLDWQRFGRGKALQESARRLVWRVYEEYNAALKALNRIDWQDMTLQALATLTETPLEALYDQVLIDEAQDLTAAQFTLVQKMVRHTDGQPALFLVGDSSQTLYTRGFTWAQVGLKLQGNSFRIRRNFRSTRQIAEAAAQLLTHNRILSSAQEMVDPAASLRNGPRPILLQYREDSQEKALVRERILSLVGDQSFRLSDIAILCPTKELCREYVDALENASVPCFLHSEGRFEMLENRVKVLTLHSAKGLEFPVVFIAGLRSNMLPQGFARGNSEEAAFEYERQRVLLYVGMTRAAEALYLVAPVQSPSPFIAELGTSIYHEPTV